MAGLLPQQGGAGAAAEADGAGVAGRGVLRAQNARRGAAPEANAARVGDLLAGLADGLERFLAGHRISSCSGFLKCPQDCGGNCTLARRVVASSSASYWEKMK